MQIIMSMKVSIKVCVYCFHIIFIHKTCRTLLWSCTHAALFTRTKLTSGRHVCEPTSSPVTIYGKLDSRVLCILVQLSLNIGIYSRWCRYVDADDTIANMCNGTRFAWDRTCYSWSEDYTLFYLFFFLFSFPLIFLSTVSFVFSLHKLSFVRMLQIFLRTFSYILQAESMIENRKK
jgi:hypothetical protein